MILKIPSLSHIDTAEPVALATEPVTQRMSSKVIDEAYYYLTERGEPASRSKKRSLFMSRVLEGGLGASWDYRQIIGEMCSCHTFNLVQAQMAFEACDQCQRDIM